MRIFEIISTHQRTVSVSDPRKIAGRPEDPSGMFRVELTPDEGVFSRVIDDPREPGMIHKFNYRALPDGQGDGAWLWMQAVIDSGLMAENPCLPRVYEQVSYQSPSSGRRRWVIERLVPAHKFDSQQIMHMIANWTDYDKWRGFAGRYGRYINDPWFLFVISLERAAHGDSNILSTLRQPLADACKMAGEISREKGVRLDIHSGNVMIRPGPGGLTPVITDPLSYVEVDES